MKSKIFILLLSHVVSICIISAQPGTLDFNFGDKGKIISKAYGYCYAGALQTNGKIIASGYGGDGISEGFSIAQYLPEGVLDSSFGRVITDFGYNAETVFSLKVQVDGKILAAGDGYLENEDILIARYLSNGSLDSSFGNKGKIITDFGEWEYCRSINLQTDGKIVLTGFIQKEAFGENDVLVVRYMPDGSLDKSFGNEGKVTTVLPFDTYSTCEIIQPDGKIIISGYIWYGGIDEKFLTIRYNEDGTVDSSFGVDGKVITDFGKGGDRINTMVISA